MDKNAEEYRNELVKALPSLVAIAFGGVESAIIGGCSCIWTSFRVLQKIK